ncbi:hypothetical protein CYMTET_47834 [Cymbomonas tetramitiformis]|uniref:Uncharacterized protein n=1 Tax=Cymbomonas tetramitiformis TaxID=36881 RepID=A0AAE0BV78_9CHLO|nr:hypothetical protein CYMTET_47834 [Cymbomonas tetramitiformis]
MSYLSRMSTFSAKRKRLQHGFDFERIIQDADSSLNGRAGAQAAVDAGASSSSVPNEQNDECLWELRTNVLHARGTAQATESVPSHVPCRSKVDIEGVPGAFLVPDVLSPDECELLIGLAEQLGFTPGEGIVSVPREAGAALCFWHGDHPQSPLHEGSALAEGSCEPKYVIRTDVLFYKPLNAAQDLQWESSKTNLAMMRAMAL